MNNALELRAVFEHYDLGTVSSVRRLDHGYVNEVWTVDTTAGAYVLRRRHPRLCAPQVVAAQHALIRHLHRAGFPAPRIYRDRNGASFLSVQDRVYEVYEYLYGGLCDVAQPAHVSSAAQTLGRYHKMVVGFDHAALHRASPRYGVSVLARTVRRLMHEWRGKVSAQVERLCSLLSTHVADLEDCLDGLQSLPELVIHGDYYAENLILRDDKVVGVLDYDQAHWCPRALEVAEALIFFAKEREMRLQHIVYSGALDLGSVERFLADYSRVICLSDAEIDALAHLVRLIWMCAALDPPLRPRPSAEAAAHILPEVLYLADWAKGHGAQLQEVGFGVRKAAQHIARR